MISLNPIPSVIYYCDLIHAKNQFNLGRKNKLSLSEYLYFKEIDFDKEINKPFNGLAYYKRFAKTSKVRATVKNSRL